MRSAFCTVFSVLIIAVSVSAPASTDRSTSRLASRVQATLHPPQACDVSPACKNLRSYPRSNLRELSALGGTQAGLCGERSDEQDNDACRPDKSPSVPASNRYAKNFKPETKTARIKLGYIDLTDAQKPAGLSIDVARRQFGNKFESIKSNLTNRCCGADASCTKAFKSVGVQFCKPTATEPCTTGAHFSPGDLTTDTFYEAMRGRLVAESKLATTPSDKAFYETQMKYVQRRNYWNYYARKVVMLSDTYTGDATLTSGSIVVSPYIKPDGSFETNDETLQHELTHACSHIRRQIDALNEKDPAVYAALYKSIYQSQMKNSCDVEPLGPAYQKLFSTSVFPVYRLDANASKTAFSCFMNVARSSKTGTSSRAACENACPAEYLEEAFAELNHLNWREPNKAFHRLCATIRDSLHGYDADYAECLAQVSAPFRNLLKSTMGCE